MYAQNKKTDSIGAKKIAAVLPGKSIVNNEQLSNGQKRMAAAFKTVDTNRIVKRTPTFVNKNAPKSAQDPNALSFGNFKVSKELYGKYAEYIMDYVKKYNNNFGPRMSRIKAANKGYFTMIDNTMRKNNIPKEMHSLAVIESALNPNATSGVGAAGPWQFMPGTAEMLGLQVNETIDERRDFYKSTQAAAKYTRRLHNMFHDWLLVVASYNCGPAPVLRHLARTGGNSFWDIKQFLPAETQNHVMAFIATSVFYDKNTKVLDFGNLPRDAKKITVKDLGKGGGSGAKTKAKNAKEQQTKPEEPANNKVAVNNDEDNDMAVAEEKTEAEQQILPEEASQIITLKVKGSYNLEVIAEILDCDVNKLRRWNPKFNELASVPGSQVKLTIPSNKLDVFIIKKEKILSECIKNPNVKSGNTVFVKSKTTTPTATGAKTTEVTTKVKQEVIGAKNITHGNADAKKIVETNSKVPLKSTSKDISKVNSLETQKSTAAKIDFVEKVKTTEKKKYTIKKGDNLIEIAEQFGMTVARLMELNKLKNKEVQVGHTLYLE